MAALTLEVLICTMGREGLDRVAAMQLPRVDNVRYLVSWQNPQPHMPVPATLQRPDLRIVPNEATCLSANRNASLDAATGDILLLADDDLTFYPEALKALISVFAEHRSLDLVTLRYDGDTPKPYPPSPTPLNPWPKNYWVSSVEIAIRREGRAGALRFDERFGLSAPMFGAGEENIFMLQAMRRGARGMFYPLTICRHPGVSTSTSQHPTPKVLRAVGAQIVLQYGWLGAMTRLPLKIWRLWKGQNTPLWFATRYVIAGALRTPRDLYKDIRLPVGTRLGASAAVDVRTRQGTSLQGGETSLQVLIVTCGQDGLERVARMQLPQVTNVTYLVSWQGGDKNTEIPAALQRPDIHVVTNDAAGVSANRNAALEAATGDILLMADDDLRYYPEGLRGIIKAFDQHPQMQLGAFRYDGPDNKTYPNAVTLLRPALPHFNVTTFEMAIRREALTDDIRFDERFGPGAPRYQSGEDEIFLLNTLRRGLNGEFIPLTICRHEGRTTGFSSHPTAGVLQGYGAIITANRGRLAALPRLPLKAWRLRRGGQSGFWHSLYHIAKGAICTPSDLLPRK